ncbi:MAG: DUF1499 domain-containing protein [Proteobacteria bacterium]|nr:DUF1499 domain-containing protein [Pseudomonadota bacterium]
MKHKRFSLVALACVAVVALLPGCAGTQPDNLGVHDGRLSACPSSPNCISSSDSDERHAVAPIVLGGGDGEPLMDRVARAVESLPGARVVERTDSYLHAEFSSRVFGFVDDLECLVDESARSVQLRSAARLGYWDFGVNRARAQQLRVLLQSP